MPYLWFDGTAKEAVEFYVNLFPNSKIDHINYWGEGQPFPAHQVQNCGFSLCELNMYAMDAGPHYQFTGAISFFVHCGTQEELDSYHAALVEGGVDQQCGWVVDRFGISWQLIPMQFIAMMNNPTGGNIGNMMESFLKMNKINIAELEKAFSEY